MKKLILKGRPHSTGSMYKSHCRFGFPTVYITAKGRALKEDYQWQAKQQWKGKPLSGRLSVVINTYHDNHQKNDWDNFHKLSMDALSGIVYLDDSQIEEAVIIKRYDKKNPRIELIINELS